MSLSTLIWIADSYKWYILPAAILYYELSGILYIQHCSNERGNSTVDWIMAFGFLWPLASVGLTVTTLGSFMMVYIFDDFIYPDLSGGKPRISITFNFLLYEFVSRCILNFVIVIIFLRSSWNQDVFIAIISVAFICFLSLLAIWRFILAADLDERCRVSVGINTSGSIAFLHRMTNMI